MKRSGVLLGLLFVFMFACDARSTNVVSDRLQKTDADTGQPSADAGALHDAGGAIDGARPQPHVPTLCGAHVCACDDGNDNDGDALIDGLDPECTGPYDDDESSFATGAPVGRNQCRDCFWDNNAGSGDDDCRYPQECFQNQAVSGKGACSSCNVSQRCSDNCQKRTPNGCDCFGCCEITRTDGTTLQVELTESCSLAKLDDVVACPRCVQNTACRNPCGHCELCSGRRADTLPADCNAAAKDAGPRYVCDEGQQVCTETTSCAAGAYCQLGCCLYAVQ